MKSITVLLHDPVYLRLADGRMIKLTYTRHPSMARGKMRLEIDAPKDVQIISFAKPSLPGMDAPDGEG